VIHPGDLAHATALVFVAYTGYGRIATLGEEVREPARTIPRAMVITLAATALLYLVVASTAVGAVGAPVLAEATRTTSAPLEASAPGCRNARPRARRQREDHVDRQRIHRAHLLLGDEHLRVAHARERATVPARAPHRRPRDVRRPRRVDRGARIHLAIAFAHEPQQHRTRSDQLRTGDRQRGPWHERERMSAHTERGCEHDNCSESGEQLLTQFEGKARSAQAPERGRMDLRTYGVGAQILRELGVSKMHLMGQPRRMPSMAGYGLEITGYIPKE